jgi:hypothetical protein
MEVSGCFVIFSVTLGIGTYKYLMDWKQKENEKCQEETQQNKYIR